MGGIVVKKVSLHVKSSAPVPKPQNLGLVLP